MQPFKDTMWPLEVTLYLTKETKNTFRFEAPAVGGEKPPVDQIYVQKAHFESTAPPKRLLVTVVEVAE